MDLCCGKPNLNSCMIKRRKAGGEKDGRKNFHMTSAKIFGKHVYQLRNSEYSIGLLTLSLSRTLWDGASVSKQSKDLRLSKRALSEK